MPQEDCGPTVPNDCNTTRVHLNIAGKIVKMSENMLARWDSMHLEEPLESRYLLVARCQILRKANASLVNDIASKLQHQK